MSQDLPKRLIFWVAMIALVSLFAIVAVGIAWPFLFQGTPLPQGTLLPGSQAQQRYRELAAQVAGIYDTVPDARIGRVLQRDVTKDEAGTSVHGNNAGMRSQLDYAQKSPDRYRIVFLGDSFTYGFGGSEQDRYSDQIDDILNQAGVTAEGKAIEVINLSIGSWTAVNEAQYLTTRLSAYDPDLIVVLTVSNDIADTQGVRGIGSISNEFSPEFRHRGSGVFNDAWPSQFGVPSINLLRYDFGPESWSRWQSAAEAFQRLEQLQSQREGLILFTVFDENPYFNALVLHYFHQAGIRSPLGLVDYLDDSEDNRLTHDPHPNRDGHRLLAWQTLDHLKALGWLQGEIPAVDASMPLWIEPTSDGETIAGFRRTLGDRYLKPSLDFSRLDPDDTTAFLGGIMPDRDSENCCLSTPPIVAPYAAFLLRQEPSASKALLKIRLPDKLELYPLEITLTLQGSNQENYRYGPEDGGREVTLEAPLPAFDPLWPGVEVRLESNRHYSEIEDHRTRSFYLLTAWQE